MRTAVFTFVQIIVCFGPHVRDVVYDNGYRVRVLAGILVFLCGALWSHALSATPQDRAGPVIGVASIEADFQLDDLSRRKMKSVTVDALRNHEYNAVDSAAPQLKQESSGRPTVLLRGALRQLSCVYQSDAEIPDKPITPSTATDTRFVNCTLRVAWKLVWPGTEKHRAQRRVLYKVETVALLEAAQPDESALVLEALMAQAVQSLLDKPAFHDVLSTLEKQSALDEQSSRVPQKMVADTSDPQVRLTPRLDWIAAVENHAPPIYPVLKYGGLAALAGGLSMVIITYAAIRTKESVTYEKFDRYNKINAAGWIVTGAGAGMIVAAFFLLPFEKEPPFKVLQFTASSAPKLYLSGTEVGLQMRF